MYEFKKIGKLFTSKFVGNGPSSYEKRIYRAAVSQKLRNSTVQSVSAYQLALCNVLCKGRPDFHRGRRLKSLIESAFFFQVMYISCMFKVTFCKFMVCKSVHHHTFN